MEIFIFIGLHTFIVVSTREIAKCTYVMFLSNMKCSAQKWNKNENTRVRPRNSSSKWKHQMENFSAHRTLQFRSFCTRLLSWREFKGIWNHLRAIFTFIEEDECAFILQQSFILCSYGRYRMRFAQLKVYDSFFFSRWKRRMWFTHDICSRALENWNTQWNERKLWNFSSVNLSSHESLTRICKIGIPNFELKTFFIVVSNIFFILNCNLIVVTAANFKQITVDISINLNTHWITNVNLRYRHVATTKDEGSECDLARQKRFNS